MTRRSVEDIVATGETIMEIAATAESVAGAVHEQSRATASIAVEATSAAGNARLMADALRMFAETVDQTQKFARVALEISRTLSDGDAQVAAAMGELFAFASRHQTMTKLVDVGRAADQSGQPPSPAASRHNAS
jgi:methyl-accepting chemotaxis protein